MYKSLIKNIGKTMKTLALSLLLTLEVMGYSFFQSDTSINKAHLELIHTIKDTVINTQKTRGLTNNYMNGNVVAQLLVYGQRKQMLNHFKSMETKFQKLELPPNFYTNASTLMQRSKALNQGAFKSDSAEVFSAYSNVIEQWMDLNEGIISWQFKEGEPQRYQGLLLLNNVLLPLTENIGKMRGMGSGIVARGYCKEVETKKMQSFVSEIQRYSILLQHHMSQTHYSALSSRESLAINEHIQEYASLTQQKVISQKDIELVTNEYFDQGTMTISEVLKIYNVVAASL